MRSFRFYALLLLIAAFATLTGCQSTAMSSAKLYEQQGKPEEAIRVLKEGTVKEPANAEIWYQLGVLHGKQNQFTEMNEALNKAASMNAAYLPKADEQRSFYWKTHNNNGITLGNENKNEEALKEFQLAAQIDDKKAQSQFGIGWIYAKLGKHEEAVPHLVKATDMDPTDKNAWHQLISEYYVMKKDDDLIAACKKLLQTQPTDAVALEYAARAYEAKKETDSAVQYYEQVVKVKPNDGNIWFNLGALYGTLKKFDDAARCFKETLKYSANDKDALFNLTLVLNRLEKYDDALMYAEQLIKVQPDKPEGHRLQGEAYRGMAEKFEKSGNEAKADEYKTKTAQSYKKAQELSGGE